MGGAEPDWRGGVSPAPVRPLADPGHDVSKRRLDLSTGVALVVVLALLPAALAVLFPLWLGIDALGWDWTPTWRVFLGGYLALGVTLFTRPVQRLLLGAFFQVRRPSAEEELVLGPAWTAVIERAGVPRGRYLLSVSDRGGLNAFASAGHIVAVTSTAIYELETDELEGVLAHELSHHLGLHPVSLLVGYWLSLPILTFARLGFWMSRVASLISLHAWWGLRSTSGISMSLILMLVRLVSSVVALGLWVVAGLARALLWVTSLLGRIVGRRTEFRADQGAVELGFGPPLANALIRFADGQPEEGHRSVGDRLFGSHPPVEVRVRRIQDHMSGISI